MRSESRKLATGLLGGAALGLLLSLIWQKYVLAQSEEEETPPKQQTDLVQFQEGDPGDVPENAPHDCPGVDSDRAGKASACEGCPNRSICASGGASGAKDAQAETQMSIAYKLGDIRKKILVLSGKGGVGKSTVATQLAWALQSQGKVVGLLDIDICGPSIPRMTGTQKEEVKAFAEGWVPVAATPNFLVMSVGYMLPEEDGAVIWRGPKKNGLIKQFLTDVYWGALDYLIIDTPPGTSDEHLSIVTYLKEAKIDGAVIVTTPQEISLLDVRKEITFCKQTQIKVLGVVENMANSVFSEIDPEATKRTCTKMEVPYAGFITMDSTVTRASEEGRPVPPESIVGKQFQDLCSLL